MARSRATCGTTRRGTSWPLARSGSPARPARSPSFRSPSTYRAGVHVHAGEFAAASALIEEADAITAATGNAPLRYASLFLAAWRGEEAQALKLIEARVRDATARGEGRAIGLAEYVTAVLYNGLGRYEAALAGAQQACEHDDLGFFGWSLVELVEAGARSGARDAAAARSSATRGTNPRRRHRLGARHPGPVTRAAQRRPGRRRPVPRGHRAARAQPDRRAPRPRPPGVRRVAAPREPARGRARATA